MVDEFKDYDMVLVQRCYLRQIIDTVRGVCDFLNIPLIFEVDDSYTEIPLDNPAHFSMISKEDMEANKGDLNKLEELRQVGLYNYKEIISMMDGIIVTTEELKNALYMYNKNIFVLQNNIEEVPPYRSHDPEQAFIKINAEGGQYVDLEHRMGVYSVPDHTIVDETRISWTPRFGYSATVTHWGQDFDTIKDYYAKVIEKYSASCWFVWQGWDRFLQWHLNLAKEKNLPARVLHIPDAQYSLYLMNLRNIDIGLAPLAPNVFNMSKSDIKAVEYAMWGAPAILPNYITYTRNWKHNENCLIYQNGKEFIECAEALIHDVNLRERLGKAARKYVMENRLERQHAARRYEIYRWFIDSKNKLKTFTLKEMTGELSKN
jgi:glycosyltransferase involved in cell wall biosynthesis